MKTFLNFVSLLLAAIAVLFCLGIVGVWVVFWFSGMIQLGSELWNLPTWVMILGPILIAWLLPGGAIVLAIFAFIGTIHYLDWPWFGAMVCYLPTIAFAFMSFIVTILTGVVAGLVAMWDAMTNNFKT